ncbi:MAG: tetratricopeptide repeat protein [Planctomycetes bacterium]|nr:tetratricopeptide repeat protein [Planctomycetota bacterium]
MLHRSISRPFAFVAFLLAAALPLLARAGEDWLATGEARLKQQQYDGALEAFQKVLAENPGSIAAHVGIGRCKMGLDDLDSAIEELEQARKFDDSSANAALYLGIARYSKAQELAQGGAQATVVGSLYRDAQSALNAAIAHDPKNWMAYEYVGLVAFQQEAYDEAATALKKAIEIKPDEAFPHYQLGEIAYVQEKYAEAAPHFVTAVKLAPTDAGSYQRLGYCYQFLNQTDKAEETYRRAIQKLPDSQLAWDDLYRLYAGNNKYKDAVEAYKRLLQSDAKNAKAHWYLGYVYREVGVDDKALEEFKKALELSPKMFAAHHQIGLVQENAKDLDGAIKSFQKSLALQKEAGIDLTENETVQKLWGIGGRTLVEADRVTDAIAVLRDLTAAVPENGAIWSDLGLVLRDSKKYEESLAAYQKAVSLLPEDPQILNDCAVILDYHLNRKDEAMVLYTKAVEHAENIDALDNLSRNLFEKKRYLESIQMCDRALAVEPGRPKVKERRDAARAALKKESTGGGADGGF